MGAVQLYRKNSKKPDDRGKQGSRKREDHNEDGKTA